MFSPLERLGKAIADARKSAGLNQTAFASAVGVSQAAVSDWESGQIDIPYSTLCRIAEKLQTSPAALTDQSVPVADSLDGRRLALIQKILTDDRLIEPFEVAVLTFDRKASSDKKRKSAPGR
jgi:transcriptional regulator with XRE-family HTH domain